MVRLACPGDGWYETTFPHQPEIFARSDWQMSLGDRAALEGLVAQVKPGLAIEIGTAYGGSLERIAAHSTEVHALDIIDSLQGGCPPNATIHIGDSKQTLPELLTRFATEGRNVDFVLVDGDHSALGVRSDLQTLLASPAIGRAVILLHDSFNPRVRSGIQAASPAEHAKVVGVDLDFVPGRMTKSDPFAGQLWGGFALVLVGDPGTPGALPAIEFSFGSFGPVPLEFCDAYETVRRAAPLIESHSARAPSIGELRREL